MHEIGQPPVGFQLARIFRDEPFQDFVLPGSPVDERQLRQRPAVELLAKRLPDFGPRFATG